MIKLKEHMDNSELNQSTKLSGCLKLQNEVHTKFYSYFSTGLSNALVGKGNAMNHIELFFQAGDKG
jgi:hypothetical protein